MFVFLKKCSSQTRLFAFNKSNSILVITHKILGTVVSFVLPTSSNFFFYKKLLYDVIIYFFQYDMFSSFCKFIWLILQYISKYSLLIATVRKIKSHFNVYPCRTKNNIHKYIREQKCLNHEQLWKYNMYNTEICNFILIQKLVLVHTKSVHYNL